jgi:hypothetical protein
MGEHSERRSHTVPAVQLGTTRPSLEGRCELAVEEAHRLGCACDGTP